MTRTLKLGFGLVLLGAIASSVFVWKPWSRTQAADTPTPELASADLPDAQGFGSDPPVPKKEQFGEGRNAPPAGGALKAIPFDDQRVMKYLRALCDIGPRVSGTPGMTKQQEILIKHFEGLGAKIVKQTFQARQASRREPVTMTNLIVQWYPDRPRRVILCAHYDTRPMAHEEANRANWTKPFLSANDGTSGVAMFMEMAHQMKDFPTQFGVDFVIFDGEEYIFEPTGPFGGGDRFFIGSDHFGEQYTATRDKRKFKYEAAILFDLFAHPGAKFEMEGNSMAFAPSLVEQIWKLAAALNVKGFALEAGIDVSDDHLALNRAGIPAIDIIDFDGYKDHWHKLSDTPERCSGAQISEVARLMNTWLQLIR